MKTHLDQWTLWVANQQRVFKLDVAVGNALAMKVVHGDHELLENPAGCLLRQVAVAHHIAAVSVCDLCRSTWMRGVLVAIATVGVFQDDAEVKAGEEHFLRGKRVLVLLRLPSSDAYLELDDVGMLL